MSDEFNYIILTRAHGFCVYYSRLLRTRIIYQGIVNPKQRPMLKSNLLNFYQFATESARTWKIFLYLFFVLILHFGQVRALSQNPQKNPLVPRTTYVVMPWMINNNNKKQKQRDPQIRLPLNQNSDTTIWWNYTYLLELMNIIKGHRTRPKKLQSERELFFLPPAQIFRFPCMTGDRPIPLLVRKSSLPHLSRQAAGSRSACPLTVTYPIYLFSLVCHATCQRDF